MNRTVFAATIALVVAVASPSAQRRITSPDGHAATEIRGHYIGADPIYVDGKWIEISYGRPIKRGRDLWGSGATYGRRLNNGAPVWRAGADISTYLMTELPLVINGKTVEPGGYSLFIDLKPDNWTFIVSGWQPQRQYNPGDHGALWGSFGYTRDKDVVRAPMKLTTLPFSMDQLTWAFLDMSDAGGAITMIWDHMMATVPFTIGP
jgi:hypothetical protein